jgi:hypothetical protein
MIPTRTNLLTMWSFKPTYQLRVHARVLVLIYNHCRLPKRQTDRHMLQHQGEYLHVLDDDLEGVVIMLHEQIHRMVSGYADVVNDIAIVAVHLEEHVPDDFVHNRR